MCFKRCGCLVGIVLGIILGIIVGFLAFTTIIPGLIITTWVSLGLAVLSLILLVVLILTASRRTTKCICDNGLYLLSGIIGIVITAIITLSIIILPGILEIAILFGLGTLFLTITIVALMQIICCLIKSTCECRE